MEIPRPALAILAACAILCGTTAGLHAAGGNAPLYIALFRLAVAQDGKLQDFELIKVIDLLSGSNNAASIKLPQAFIDQARKKVEDQHFNPTFQDGKPTGTLTSFLYSPADAEHTPPGISLAALNGAMNNTSNFRLMGQDGAVSSFGANLGSSAFFVGYYALPSLPKTTTDQREAIVEAEIQRNSANVQNAEIISRKDFSTDSQTIVEITCKSPQNKSLVIRSRYICNDRQMLTFTAIMPDKLSSEDAQRFDQIFHAFCFP